MDLATLTDRYLTAQLAANRREALRVLLDEGYRQGASVADLLLEVIQPAQHRIGRLWEENRISVADEHVATAISQVAMAHLYQLAQRPASNGIKVAVACVPGELHDMGARVVADLLESDGFDVAFLGASVPADSLVDFVRRERPALAALSVTMTFHTESLRDCVLALRGAMGDDYPVAAGGAALARQPKLAEQLSLAGIAGDGHGLAAAVRTYFKC